MANVAICTDEALAVLGSDQIVSDNSNEFSGRFGFLLGSDIRLVDSHPLDGIYTDSDKLFRNLSHEKFKILNVFAGLQLADSEKWKLGSEDDAFSHG